MPKFSVPQIANRPAAEVPPPPTPNPFGGGGRSGIAPIALQTKRQEDFHDTAVELAAAFGWAGEPTFQIKGFAVADAQVFLRKTLHEIHGAAVAGTGLPDLSHVGPHLGLSDEHAAALVGALSDLYDDEVAELGALDAKTLERKLTANAAEDKEARKRARTAQALQGTED